MLQHYIDLNIVYSPHFTVFSPSS